MGPRPIRATAPGVMTRDNGRRLFAFTITMSNGDVISAGVDIVRRDPSPAQSLRVARAFEAFRDEHPDVPIVA